VDGAYTDNRRPDSVRFTSSLCEDLARRDFTVNAFAWNPQKGLVDAHGGMRDLEKGLIRCVGEPQKRFDEDALRILRAARFACELGFDIETHTLGAMLAMRSRLNNIARERVAAELSKAVMGQAFPGIFLSEPELMIQIIPEFAPCVGFDQHSVYHIYDVYGHMLRSVAASESDLTQRLALLLHDITKPACFLLDEKGAGHFRGHTVSGAAAARAILTALRYDKATVERVALLVLYHDTGIIPDTRHIKRWLSQIGEEAFRQLLNVQKADDMAKCPVRAAPRLERVTRVQKMLEEVISSRDCYSLKTLAVGGGDLMAAGIPEGREVGAMLSKLLDGVIEGRIENNKAALITAARKYTRLSEL
jgi:tRNA nucleotidyltransferase (CCA-adding enzyme)